MPVLVSSFSSVFQIIWWFGVGFLFVVFFGGLVCFWFLLLLCVVVFISTYESLVLGRVLTRPCCIGRTNSASSSKRQNKGFVTNLARKGYPEQSGLLCEVVV